MKTLIEVVNRMEAEIAPTEGLKAYAVRADGDEYEYIVAAKGVRDARQILRGRMSKAGKRIGLKSIQCRRSPAHDEFAKFPRASWPGWYLGWTKDNGEFYGWSQLKEKEDDDSV